ncbi:type VI immunity family protein [Hyalangium versicolor]|uniref:type VI immunity family protein n=1 Tax=Hyalangium versicolor TaxID=2861190 RepID=UPI001CCE5822|nr:type VI immunity family protein [Hyalangium versicolor]
MSEHPPRIRVLAENGYVLVREGLSITFYMRHAHVELAQSLEHALKTYLRAVGPGALGLYADRDGEWQALDASGWELIWSQLREDPQASLDLQDGSKLECRYRVEYRGRSVDGHSAFDNASAVSAVSFGLPSEFLEEHGPSRVRELALELAAALPFCSGHTGLSFLGELDMAGVDRRIASSCFRYPGLDIPDLSGRSWKIGTRVIGPQWLTFLGQPVLGELGGSATLRSRLHSPNTTVQELGEDRAVVTLGPWPEAGDTEHGDTLPAYRELAQVLEPWLFHEPHGSMAGLPRQDVPRWERRFLD